MAKTEYTSKVDALLEHATALGFTEEDFADLALAAADQAGLSGNEQHTIAGLLGVTSYAMRPPVASHAASCDCTDCPLNRCTECSRPVDGYRPTRHDAKLAPADGLCEMCHAEYVRAAKRDRADAIREGRGDYLRDMRKGAV